MSLRISQFKGIEIRLKRGENAIRGLGSLRVKNVPSQGAKCYLMNNNEPIVVDESPCHPVPHYNE